MLERDDALERGEELRAREDQKRGDEQDKHRSTPALIQSGERQSEAAESSGAWNAEFEEGREVATEYALHSLAANDIEFSGEKEGAPATDAESAATRC